MLDYNHNNNLFFKIMLIIFVSNGGCPHDIVANVLDNNLIVSKFKLQLHLYVHFWTNTHGKGMNFFILCGI